MSQKTCSDCEGNRLTYNLHCFGCAVRLAKTAKKGHKQLESMLHYIGRYQNKQAVKDSLFKRAKKSPSELPTSNEVEVKPRPNGQGSLF